MKKFLTSGLVIAIIISLCFLPLTLTAEGETVIKTYADGRCLKEDHLLDYGFENYPGGLFPNTEKQTWSIEVYDKDGKLMTSNNGTQVIDAESGDTNYLLNGAQTLNRGNSIWLGARKEKNNEDAKYKHYHLHDANDEIIEVAEVRLAQFNVDDHRTRPHAEVRLVGLIDLSNYLPGTPYHFTLEYLSSLRKGYGFDDVNNPYQYVGWDAGYAEFALLDANQTPIQEWTHGKYSTEGIDNAFMNKYKEGTVEVSKGITINSIEGFDLDNPWWEFTRSGTLPENAKYAKIVLAGISEDGSDLDVKMHTLQLIVGENHHRVEYQDEKGNSLGGDCVKEGTVPPRPENTDTYFWYPIVDDAPGTPPVDKDHIPAITGDITYRKVPDVLEPGDPNHPIPEAYSVVTFDTTELSDTPNKTFYVNPNVSVALKPGFTPQANSNAYVFEDWENYPLQDDGSIGPHQFAQNTTINAMYKSAPVPETSTRHVYINTDVPLEDLKQHITIPEDGPQPIDGGYVLLESPDTSTTGEKIAKIQITYDNGTVGTVEVPVKVWPLVSDTDPGTPPEGANPDGSAIEYVKVTFDPTDKSTNPEISKTIWVAKDKDVTIEQPETDPIGKITDDGTYVFTDWEDIPPAFSGDQTIPANFDIVKSDTAIVPVGKEFTDDELKELIELPGDLGSDAITQIKIADDGKPDVTKPGSTHAMVEVSYEKDGQTYTATVKVPIDVVDRILPDPNGADPNYDPDPDSDRPVNIPNNYVPVIVDPDAAQSDSPRKVYWVTPEFEVDLEKDTSDPVTDPLPRDQDDPINPVSFVGWDRKTKDTFTQKTTITALYVTPTESLTPIGETPLPESFEDKIDLPGGYTIDDNGTWDYDTEPDVDNLGPTTGIVNVPVIKPDGTTDTIQIKVPVTVVPRAIPDPQADDEDYTPNPDNPPEGVPDNYVPIVINPTDKAVDSDRKIVWVTPNGVVDLQSAEDYSDPIQDPTPVNEDSIDDPVTFLEWDDSLKQQFEGPGPVEITALYASADATLTPVNFTPRPNDYKDKIKLPEGYTIPEDADISYVEEPVVNKLGQTTAVIKVPIERNGVTEEFEITVPITVVPPVIEGDPDGSRPDGIPENYVRVTVDPTDKATDSTKEYFWVTPEYAVSIPAKTPHGKVTDTYIYSFIEWDTPLKGKFTAHTTIRAKYRDIPNSGVWVLETPVGKMPTEEELKRHIKVPKGLEITDLEVLEEPDVSKPGDTTATVRVTYSDGSTETLIIPVRVFAPAVPRLRYTGFHKDNLWQLSDKQPPATHATEQKVDAASVTPGTASTNVPRTGEDRATMLNTGVILILTAGVLLVLRKRR